MSTVGISHYRISAIKPNDFSIEYYDTLTKKGATRLASELNDDDIIDLFSQEDQRLIAYHAGKQETNLGKVRKNIKLAALEEKKYVFLIFVSLYTVIFFSSNLAGSTIISLGSIAGVPLAAPGAIFVYSLTFLFDSILTEIYGFSIVRRIYTTVALTSFVALVILSILAMLPTMTGHNYVRELVFSEANVLRVFVFSFASFLSAEFINTNIIARLKYYSRKKYGYNTKKEQNRIIVRFIIATAVGTFVDSVVFGIGVFLFVIPFKSILIIIATQYVIKLSYDIIACLFSSKIAMYIKRLEKTDIVELPSNRITDIVGFKIDADRCVNTFNTR
ncbi:VUT family protein [Facilibium subflavum]|uniref:VUT family protein n=1 Tax=Facilibium subflavum TaxID=2219058 RepID=UPI000E6498C8|nr:VUT family protein [Facilibium subflavum]